MSRFRVSHSGLLVTFILLAALLFALPLASAQDTWTGSGTNNHPAKSNHWSPTSVPSNGDALIFPAGAARLNPLVDFASTETFDTVSFGDDAYSMTGDGIGITNGIFFNNPSNNITVSLTTSTA